MPLFQDCPTNTALQAVCWKLTGTHHTAQIPQKRRCPERLPGGSWWWFSPASCLLWQKILISRCLPSISASPGTQCWPRYLSWTVRKPRMTKGASPCSLLSLLLKYHRKFERDLFSWFYFKQSAALGYSLQVLLADHRFMIKKLLKASRSHIPTWSNINTSIQYSLLKNADGSLKDNSEKNSTYWITREEKRWRN